MKCLLLVRLGFALVGSDAGAAGSAPLGFLLVEPDARSAGMAGSGSAILDGAAALSLNPSRLGASGNGEGLLTHGSLPASINFEHIGFVHPIGVGAALRFMSYGAIQQTTISNPTGTNIPSERPYDAALALGFGLPVGEWMRVGISGCAIRESLGTVQAQGLAGDVGLSILPHESVSLGATIQNLGPSLKFGAATEELPRLLRMGAGYSPSVLRERLRFAVDLLQSRGDSIQGAIGGEVRLGRVAAARAGWTSRIGTGLPISLGAGIIAGSFGLDYAYSGYGNLGDIHRVDLRWRWASPSMTK
ncbi:MAG: PorV/PorQ family protein [Elusimicrobia bacterium]|nr:PorV/PorQ family protein [Elusimicrobiota bacterium]